MNAARRIRLIRIIEKIEKNPEFSNKLGVKNTSDFISDKQQKICMIWFVGKFFIFGLKASWGILKLLCTVIFFPVILIGMVVGGLMYIAFPLLIIGGIIGLVTSHS